MILLVPSCILQSDGSPNFGWTAFLWACMKGHSEIVDKLIEHGADINFEDVSIDFLGRIIAALYFIRSLCFNYLADKEVDRPYVV